MSKVVPRTIQDWVNWGARRFTRAGIHFGHGADNAHDEAYALVRWALKLPHQPTPLQLRKAVSPAHAKRVQTLLDLRIATRKPAAYLTGESWFAGLRFEVDERVLIPRSPIAELIVERFRPWITYTPRRILDLCAGSGCIGIACARAFPRAQVDAIELDSDAMRLLKRNIAHHRLGKRVRAIQSDLFGKLKNDRYDLIVSNPPYVPTTRWRAMPAEYAHEPKLALEAGRDGMDLVQRIVRESPRFLTGQGTLVCEVGGSVPEFNRRFPELPVIWPEFEHGGDGVFVINREELLNGWTKRHQR